MPKQIAVDSAKSIHQIAESVHAGQVTTQTAESRGVARIYTGASEAGRVTEGDHGAHRPNKATVALANKLVRVCWAVWCHERRCSGVWKSRQLA